MSIEQSVSSLSRHHFSNSSHWRHLSDLFWINIHKARIGHKAQRRKRQCRGIIKSQTAMREAFSDLHIS